MKKNIMLALGLTFALTSSVVPAFAYTNVTSVTIPASVIPINTILDDMAVPTVQGEETTTTTTTNITEEVITGYETVTSGSFVKSASTYLNVRTGPSTSSDKITILSPAQQVTVLEENVNGSGWDKISLGADKFGYSSNQYLSLISRPTTTQVPITETVVTPVTTTTTTSGAQGAVVSYGAAQNSENFTQFDQGYKFSLKAEVNSVPIYNIELNSVIGFVMAGDVIKSYDTDSYVSDLGFTLVSFDGKLGYASTQDFNFSRTNLSPTR